MVTEVAAVLVAGRVYDNRVALWGLEYIVVYEIIFVLGLKFSQFYGQGCLVGELQPQVVSAECFPSGALRCYRSLN